MFEEAANREYKSQNVQIWLNSTLLKPEIRNNGVLIESNWSDSTQGHQLAAGEGDPHNVEQHVFLLKPDVFQHFVGMEFIECLCLFCHYTSPTANIHTGYPLFFLFFWGYPVFLA